MQKYQWKYYQSQELIPSPWDPPQENLFPLIPPLSRLWRSFVNHLTHQFNAFEQLEHLEHCWSLDKIGDEILLPSKAWQFPAYLGGGLLLTSDPNIWNTVNDQSQSCWHIYDPRTGQIIHFDTEEEVRTWIENRYYAS